MLVTSHVSGHFVVYCRRTPFRHCDGTILWCAKRKRERGGGGRGALKTKHQYFLVSYIRHACVHVMYHVLVM